MDMADLRYTPQCLPEGSRAVRHRAISMAMASWIWPWPTPTTTRLLWRTRRCHSAMLVLVSPGRRNMCGSRMPAPWRRRCLSRRQPAPAAPRLGSPITVRAVRKPQRRQEAVHRYRQWHHYDARGQGHRDRPTGLGQNTIEVAAVNTAFRGKASIDAGRS